MAMQNETETATLTLERRFNASPERVFDAWLDPKTASRWLFATPTGVSVRCEIDARVGGGFRIDEDRGGMRAEHSGTFVELDRPRRIVFDFATTNQDAPTRVTIDIAPDGDGALLTLTHVFDAKWKAVEDRARAGWNEILFGLGRTLWENDVETGRALPMREEHGGFTVERLFKAPPTKVFAAFSTPETKRRWYAEGHDFAVERFEMQFKVGGRDVARFRFKGGILLGNDTTYLDIVPNRRIVTAYTMSAEGKPFSASLATMLFLAEGEGTKFVYTEQGVFFEGSDGAKMREQGSRSLFDKLAKEVE